MTSTGKGTTAAAALCIVVLVLAGGCSTADKTILSNPGGAGVLQIWFSFDTGSYPWLMGTKYPQLAVWVESEDGVRRTVFVSVVYRANFMAGRQEAEMVPEIAGHGHVLGRDHRINRDMRHITTAASLFKEVGITYFPEPGP